MPEYPDWLLAFLTEADLDAVTRAIVTAESATSAEIRVHLEPRCVGDPMARAIEVFESLGMHRTALRHGVLLYVAVLDRRLAVIGDRGIHQHLGDARWRALVSAAAAHFSQQRPLDGILHAIRELGAELTRHFPRRPDDTNELSDQVSVG